MFAVSLLVCGIRTLRPTVAHPTIVPPIDMRSITKPCLRADGDRLEGVHVDIAASPLAERVLQQVPELSSWEAWYKHPLVLTNGHVHTILAAKLRSTRAVRYHRQLVQTPDGGTLAIDLLAGIRRTRQRDPTDWQQVVARGAIAGADETNSDTLFVDECPPPDVTRPLLLLASGLGGVLEALAVHGGEARDAS